MMGGCGYSDKEMGRVLGLPGENSGVAPGRRIKTEKEHLVVGKIPFLVLIGEQETFPVLLVGTGEGPYIFSLISCPHLPSANPAGHYLSRARDDALSKLVCLSSSLSYQLPESKPSVCGGHTFNPGICHGAWLKLGTRQTFVQRID